MAMPLQDMPPGLRITRIGCSVIPVSGLVNVSPSDECGAGRDTDRSRRVGISEHDTSRGEPVQIWSVDDGVAITPGHATGMLIRHYDEKIRGGGFHAAFPLRISFCLRPVSKSYPPGPK